MGTEKSVSFFQKQGFLDSRMINLKKTKQNSNEIDSLVVKETRRISKEFFSEFKSIYWKPRIKSFLRGLESPSSGLKSGICKMRILLALNLIRIYFPNRWLSLREIVEIVGDDLVSESSIRRYRFSR